VVRWVVNSVLASPIVPGQVRRLVLAAYGVDIPRTAAVGPRCFFGGPNVRIGSRTSVNVGCFLDNVDRIDIGAGVRLGMEVMLITGTHEIGPSEARSGALVSGPVSIGDGCWIGARAVVLPGVSIGPGCIIGAGAVVTGDCDADGLYLGVPARRVRDL
jgi:maltose O-acetyltransferase